MGSALVRLKPCFPIFMYSGGAVPLVGWGNHHLALVCLGDGDGSAQPAEDKRGGGLNPWFETTTGVGAGAVWGVFWYAWAGGGGAQ